MWSNKSTTWTIHLNYVSAINGCMNNPAVPNTQRIMNTHRNTLSITMATYFQSSSTCNIQEDTQYFTRNEWVQICHLSKAIYLCLVTKKEHCDFLPHKDHQDFILSGSVYEAVDLSHVLISVTAWWKSTQKWITTSFSIGIPNTVPIFKQHTAATNAAGMANIWKHMVLEYFEAQHIQWITMFC